AGAVIAGSPAFAANARRWLLAALAVSAATTAAMGLPPDIYAIIALRFAGGVASAFVIVCASAVVLDRLAAAGPAQLAATHFAGVGAGIFVSAAAIAASSANGLGWQSLWIVSGVLAALAGLVAALFLRAASGGELRRSSAAHGDAAPVPIRMIGAYGLFG